MAAAELAESTKAVFKMFGSNLDTVIARAYLTLAHRCAELEARIVALESKRK
jgi:hypothetical protein